MKKIYIIISKVTTVVGKSIRHFVKSDYSHVSIALDDTCENMISFGRKKYSIPIIGGLVDEGKNINFFKHFNQTPIKMLELEVQDDQYVKLVNLIDDFKKNRKYYSFNILGVALTGLNIPFGRKNTYFCSEFVAHLLKESGIYDFNKNIKLVRPHEFLNIPNTKVVYEGIISEHKKTSI